MSVILVNYNGCLFLINYDELMILVRNASGWAKRNFQFDKFSVLSSFHALVFMLAFIRNMYLGSGIYDNSTMFGIWISNENLYNSS